VIAAGEHPGQAEFDAGHDLRVRRLPLAMRQWGLRSLTGLAGYCRTVRRLLRLIGVEQVNNVHCGRCLPEGVMALALRRFWRIPFLCYVHGEDITTATYSREHAWLASQVLRGADLVIANSRNTCRILHQEWGLSSRQVALLYPGVDTRRFAPAPPNPAVRERLGWTSRRVVLTVGRLQKRKGHDHMIQALPAIRDQVPDVLYAIIGDGEELGPLRQLAADNAVAGQVQFLGEADDQTLIDAYQQCDLFALPNRTVGKDIEGFGMVLLEAQSCGKPVLAGSSGGTSETMQAPDTGIIVDCNDIQHLAAAVARLLANSPLLARMGAAGREWVVERFDWAALSRRAQDIFQTAHRRRRSSLRELATP
jgi:phosphatidylinositol alpha-1,6-mannosyltransferase